MAGRRAECAFPVQWMMFPTRIVSVVGQDSVVGLQLLHGIPCATIGAFPYPLALFTAALLADIFRA